MSDPGVYFFVPIPNLLTLSTVDLYFIAFVFLLCAAFIFYVLYLPYITAWWVSKIVRYLLQKSSPLLKHESESQDAKFEEGNITNDDQSEITSKPIHDDRLYFEMVYLNIGIVGGYIAIRGIVLGTYDLSLLLEEVRIRIHWWSKTPVGDQWWTHSGSPRLSVNIDGIDAVVHNSSSAHSALRRVVDSCLNKGLGFFEAEDEEVERSQQHHKNKSIEHSIIFDYDGYDWLYDWVPSMTFRGSFFRVSFANPHVASSLIINISEIRDGWMAASARGESDRPGGREVVIMLLALGVNVSIAPISTPYLWRHEWEPRKFACNMVPRGIGLEFYVLWQALVVFFTGKTDDSEVFEKFDLSSNRILDCSGFGISIRADIGGKLDLAKRGRKAKRLKKATRNAADGNLDGKSGESSGRGEVDVLLRVHALAVEVSPEHLKLLSPVVSFFNPPIRKNPKTVITDRRGWLFPERIAFAVEMFRDVDFVVPFAHSGSKWYDSDDGAIHMGVFYIRIGKNSRFAIEAPLFKPVPDSSSHYRFRSMFEHVIIDSSHVPGKGRRQKDFVLDGGDRYSGSPMIVCRSASIGIDTFIINKVDSIDRIEVSVTTKKPHLYFFDEQLLFVLDLVADADRCTRESTFIHRTKLQTVNVSFFMEDVDIILNANADSVVDDGEHYRDSIIQQRNPCFILAFPLITISLTVPVSCTRDRQVSFKLGSEFVEVYFVPRVNSSFGLMHVASSVLQRLSSHRRRGILVAVLEPLDVVGKHHLIVHTNGNGGSMGVVQNIIDVRVDRAFGILSGTVMRYLLNAIDNYPFLAGHHSVDREIYVNDGRVNKLALLTKSFLRQHRMLGQNEPVHQSLNFTVSNIDIQVPARLYCNSENVHLLSHELIGSIVREPTFSELYLSLAPVRVGIDSAVNRPFADCSSPTTVLSDSLIYLSGCSFREYKRHGPASLGNVPYRIERHVDMEEFFVELRPTQMVTINDAVTNFLTLFFSYDSIDEYPAEIQDDDIPFIRVLNVRVGSVKINMLSPSSITRVSLTEGLHVHSSNRVTHSYASRSVVYPSPLTISHVLIPSGIEVGLINVLFDVFVYEILPDLENRSSKQLAFLLSNDVEKTLVDLWETDENASYVNFDNVSTKANESINMDAGPSHPMTDDIPLYQTPSIYSLKIKPIDKLEALKSDFAQVSCVLTNDLRQVPFCQSKSTVSPSTVNDMSWTGDKFPNLSELCERPIGEAMSVPVLLRSQLRHFDYQQSSGLGYFSTYGGGYSYADPPMWALYRTNEENTRKTSVMEMPYILRRRLLKQNAKNRWTTSMEQLSSGYRLNNIVDGETERIRNIAAVLLLEKTKRPTYVTILNVRKLDVLLSPLCIYTWIDVLQGFLDEKLNVERMIDSYQLQQTAFNQMKFVRKIDLQFHSVVDVVNFKFLTGISEDPIRATSLSATYLKNVNEHFDKTLRPDIYCFYGSVVNFHFVSNIYIENISTPNKNKNRPKSHATTSESFQNSSQFPGCRVNATITASVGKYSFDLCPLLNGEGELGSDIHCLDLVKYSTHYRVLFSLSGGCVECRLKNLREVWDWEESVGCTMSMDAMSLEADDDLGEIFSGLIHSWGENVQRLLECYEGYRYSLKLRDQAMSICRLLGLRDSYSVDCPSQHLKEIVAMRMVARNIQADLVVITSESLEQWIQKSLKRISDDLSVSFDSGNLFTAPKRFDEQFIWGGHVYTPCSDFRSAVAKAFGTDFSSLASDSEAYRTLEDLFPFSNGCRLQLTFKISSLSLSVVCVKPSVHSLSQQTFSFDQASPMAPITPLSPLNPNVEVRFIFFGEVSNVSFTSLLRRSSGRISQIPWGLSALAYPYDEARTSISFGHGRFEVSPTIIDFFAGTAIAILEVWLDTQERFSKIFKRRAGGHRPPTKLSLKAFSRSVMIAIDTAALIFSLVTPNRGALDIGITDITMMLTFLLDSKNTLRRHMDELLKDDEVMLKEQNVFSGRRRMDSFGYRIGDTKSNDSNSAASREHDGITLAVNAVEGFCRFVGFKSLRNSNEKLSSRFCRNVLCPDYQRKLHSVPSTVKESRSELLSIFDLLCQRKGIEYYHSWFKAPTLSLTIRDGSFSDATKGFRSRHYNFLQSIDYVHTFVPFDVIDIERFNDFVKSWQSFRRSDVIVQGVEKLMKALSHSVSTFNATFLFRPSKSKIADNLRVIPLSSQSTALVADIILCQTDQSTVYYDYQATDICIILSRKHPLRTRLDVFIGQQLCRFRPKRNLDDEISKVRDVHQPISTANIKFNTSKEKAHALWMSAISAIKNALRLRRLKSHVLVDHVIELVFPTIKLTCVRDNIVAESSSTKDGRGFPNSSTISSLQVRYGVIALIGKMEEVITPGLISGLLLVQSSLSSDLLPLIDRLRKVISPILIHEKQIMGADIFADALVNRFGINVLFDGLTLVFDGKRDILRVCSGVVKFFCGHRSAKDSLSEEAANSSISRYSWSVHIKRMTFELLWQKSRAHSINIKASQSSDNFYSSNLFRFGTLVTDLTLGNDALCESVKEVWLSTDGAASKLFVRCNYTFIFLQPGYYVNVLRLLRCFQNHFDSIRPSHGSQRFIASEISLLRLFLGGVLTPKFLSVIQRIQNACDKIKVLVQVNDMQVCFPFIYSKTQKITIHAGRFRSMISEAAGLMTLKQFTFVYSHDLKFYDHIDSESSGRTSYKLFSLPIRCFDRAVVSVNMTGFQFSFVEDYEFEVSSVIRHDMVHCENSNIIIESIILEFCSKFDKLRLKRLSDGSVCVRDTYCIRTHSIVNGLQVNLAPSFVRNLLAFYYRIQLLQRGFDLYFSSELNREEGPSGGIPIKESKYEPDIIWHCHVEVQPGHIVLSTMQKPLKGYLTTMRKSGELGEERLSSTFGLRDVLSISSSPGVSKDGSHKSRRRAFTTVYDSVDETVPLQSLNRSAGEGENRIVCELPIPAVVIWIRFATHGDMKHGDTMESDMGTTTPRSVHIDCRSLLASPSLGIVAEIERCSISVDEEIITFISQIIHDLEKWRHIVRSLSGRAIHDPSTTKSAAPSLPPQPLLEMHNSGWEFFSKEDVDHLENEMMRAGLFKDNMQVDFIDWKSDITDFINSLSTARRCNLKIFLASKKLIRTNALQIACHVHLSRSSIRFTARQVSIRSHCRNFVLLITQNIQRSVSISAKLRGARAEIGYNSGFSNLNFFEWSCREIDTFLAFNYFLNNQAEEVVLNFSKSCQSTYDGLSERLLSSNRSLPHQRLIIVNCSSVRMFIDLNAIEAITGLFSILQDHLGNPQAWDENIMYNHRFDDPAPMDARDEAERQNHEVIDRKKRVFVPCVFVVLIRHLSLLSQVAYQPDSNAVIPSSSGAYYEISSYNMYINIGRDPLDSNIVQDPVIGVSKLIDDYPFSVIFALDSLLLRRANATLVSKVRKFDSITTTEIYDYDNEIPTAQLALLDLEQTCQNILLSIHHIFIYIDRVFEFQERTDNRMSLVSVPQERYGLASAISGKRDAENLVASNRLRVSISSCIGGVAPFVSTSLTSMFFSCIGSSVSKLSSTKQSIESIVVIDDLQIEISPDLVPKLHDSIFFLIESLLVVRKEYYLRFGSVFPNSFRSKSWELSLKQLAETRGAVGFGARLAFGRHRFEGRRAHVTLLCSARPPNITQGDTLVLSLSRYLIDVEQFVKANEVIHRNCQFMISQEISSSTGRSFTLSKNNDIILSLPALCLSMYSMEKKDEYEQYCSMIGSGVTPIRRHLKVFFSSSAHSAIETNVANFRFFEAVLKQYSLVDNDAGENKNSIFRSLRKLLTGSQKYLFNASILLDIEELSFDMNIHLTNVVNDLIQMCETHGIHEWKEWLLKNRGHVVPSVMHVAVCDPVENSLLFAYLTNAIISFINRKLIP